MKKAGKHMEPCGHTESPGKAKSRIKRFEQHLECNHRLANTYANNQPGSVPKVPAYEGNMVTPWESKVREMATKYGVPVDQAIDNIRDYQKSKQAPPAGSITMTGYGRQEKKKKRP